MPIVFFLKPQNADCFSQTIELCGFPSVKEFRRSIKSNGKINNKHININSFKIGI